MKALTRIAAVVRKEFVHLIRDPRALAVVLLLPIVELLLFAYAISFDVKHVPSMIIDYDLTPASRTYIGAYSRSDFFEVLGEAAGIDSVDGIFERGEARVVVVVEPGFERAIADGGLGQVAVLVDGSEPNAARIASTYAIALNQVYGAQLAASAADRQGVDVSSFGRVEPRLRTWYNPDRTSSIYLIPGLMAVIVMIVAVQQTAVTLVRERDLHTGEQLQVSSLGRVELMVGKLLPWTILAFADMGVIVILGMTAFGVPMRGDWGFLTVASAMFIFSCLGIGLIVSSIAPSAETANVVALLMSFFPAFLLSGFAFPLESIPPVLAGLSYAFPARYMVTIARGVFLKGEGFAELWPQLASLTAYAVAVVGVASLLARRRSA